MIVNANNVFKKFKELLSDRSHFLPPKEIAPKSMAVAMFAFLFALLGGLIGFIGQSLIGIDAIAYIGVAIALLGLLVMALAMLHHFIWLIIKLLNRIFQ